jgi:hypothetical protein
VDVLWDRTPMFIPLSMMTKTAVEVPFFQPSAVEALRLPGRTPKAETCHSGWYR